MTSLRSIFFTFGLILIFIFLSIFSIIEYQDKDINNLQEDKTPLVAISTNKILTVLAYLEQLPSLRLLPVAKINNSYEAVTGEFLDKTGVNELNLDQYLTKDGKIKTVTPVFITDKVGQFSWFSRWWLNLKGQMEINNWLRS